MTIHELKTRILSGPGRLRSAGAVSVAGIALIAGTVYAGAPSARYAGTEVWDAESAAVASGEGVPDLGDIQARVERVNGGWAELADYYEEEVAPIERVLRSYRRDTALVQRIAVALVREANRVDLEPRLLLAVLLVENPWLDPEIRSPVGAIGMMQIMPVHRGAWSQCGSDLEDVDANICHGARIFAHYFRASDRDLDRALLRYNGCVNGTNTPNCHQYPSHVFARAGRASVMAWLNQGPVAGSP